MLRCKFVVQLIQAKCFAGAIAPEYRFEISTSRQTRGRRVSFKRIGSTVPDSQSSVSRSTTAEINLGRMLFAFLKGGPVLAPSLYSDLTNSIATPGTAIRRVG